MITKEIKRKIKEESHKTENECCGFIVLYTIVPCQNTSLTPQHHFSISPVDYLKVSQKGKIDFVYHSHNKNPEFSDYDKLNLYNQKLKGLLYCKETDSFHVFIPESYNNPYINKSFEIGVCDCLSIVAEYYENELNIKLPNIRRGADWYKKNPKIVEESIPLNLKKIDKNDIQKNDILVFDMLNNGMPCHFGIYLGGEILLHHPRHRLSTIEIMSEPLKKKLTYGLRKY